MVVRCLGESVASKKVGPRGAQQLLYRWVRAEQRWLMTPVFLPGGVDQVALA